MSFCLQIDNLYLCWYLLISRYIIFFIVMKKSWKKWILRDKAYLIECNFIILCSNINAIWYACKMISTECFSDDFHICYKKENQTYLDRCVTRFAGTDRHSTCKRSQRWFSDSCRKRNDRSRELERRQMNNGVGTITSRAWTGSPLYHRDAPLFACYSMS